MSGLMLHDSFEPYYAGREAEEAGEPLSRAEQLKRLRADAVKRARQPATDDPAAPDTMN